MRIFSGKWTLCDAADLKQCMYMASSQKRICPEALTEWPNGPLPESCVESVARAQSLELACVQNEAVANRADTTLRWNMEDCGVGKEA